jgi:cob(I)alamin adenosyltransferase
MKIYTRTGDKGTTSLYGGKRVAKTSALINAVGEIDELNALIGFTLAVLNDVNLVKIKRVRNLLKNLQTKLFELGADIATPNQTTQKLHIIRIKEADVKTLENEIDELSTSLPQLTKFILPGGSQAVSLIFLARAVCRRAERSVNLAAKDNKLNSQALIFLNRLSDWLFVLSRFCNFVLKKEERQWLAD